MDKIKIYTIYHIYHTKNDALPFFVYTNLNRLLMIKPFTYFFSGEEPSQIIEEINSQETEEPSMEALFFIKQFAHSFCSLGMDSNGDAMLMSLN